MTSGETSRDRAVDLWLRTAHPGKALPSVHGRCCSVILRGAAQFKLVFLKNPSSSCMRGTDFDHKLLEGEEGG